MNASYQARFEIPFILAVRGHDPPSILAQMRQRLTHERPAEIEAALHQVGLIAAYRLADTVANVATAEVAAMLRRLADGARDALALEWMRAAGLTVRQGGDGSLLGMVAAGDAPMPGSVLLGVHQSSESSTLHYQGQVGWVCALAVLQRLKEQGTPARGDVAVIARTADAALGVAAVLTQLDPDRTTVVQLPLAQLPPMRVAIVPAGGTHAEQPGALDAATGALRGFLLHTSNHE